MDKTERDYGYVYYFRKAMNNTPEHLDQNGGRDLTGQGLTSKEIITRHTMFHESIRDYFTASVRQIHHLIQIDQKPNLELLEPKLEVYKISISFQKISE